MWASLRISSGSFLVALLLISTLAPFTPATCSETEDTGNVHEELQSIEVNEEIPEKTTSDSLEASSEEANQEAIVSAESPELVEQQEAATEAPVDEQQLDSVELAEDAPVTSTEASPAEEEPAGEQQPTTDGTSDEAAAQSAEPSEEEAVHQQADTTEEAPFEPQTEASTEEVETSAEKPPSAEEGTLPTEAAPSIDVESSSDAPASQEEVSAEESSTAAPSSETESASVGEESPSSSTEQAQVAPVVEEVISQEEEAAIVSSSTEEQQQLPEEIPDPGPLPGEPAFESAMEPETSQDVPRDRSQLDAFAEAEESPEFAAATEKAIKELKKIYEASIKPLETVYEYNSVTSRGFGDSEIQSKPMILIMGPAGTGKTTAVKYLLGIDSSAVPRIPMNGPVHPRDLFTIWRWGEEASVESGSELASDWVFASMQKYGVGATDRLTGLKLPAPLLKKVTIVDSPAIIESRGHLEDKRNFPVNDVYQWFIDRADLILLVFDPLKPDVGMELEALLDQIKGREGQTRILVNKADTLTPSELATAEGDLLWNLSPMLGGNRSPQVYAVSLRPQAYKPRTCTKFIAEQETALYRDIMDVVNNRVANKAASARRHAIRVRNHSKLINLYLKAYAKAKGLFSNKKKVANSIIEDPFHYRIYQEVSFAKNVSRYDLPDPEVYREFFKQHKLFDFKKFDDLCTYFKGCPQDKLDIAIAYDLAEILGKHKREIVLSAQTEQPSASADQQGTVPNGSEMPAMAA